jgi:alpha-glucosidase
VPLPWSGTEPPFGFSPPGAVREPWLPQPKEWRDLTVEAESANDDSMLRLYRDALRIRRVSAALGDGPMTWLSVADGGVLAFDRVPAAPGAPGGGADGGVRCVANLSASPVELPPHAAVLLTSGPLTNGQLPPDTTAWLRV